MQRYGSRLLLAVSSLLSILLITLAVIQYRWAGRVAQADLERTRNQLRSAAALFARDFDLQLAQTYVFFQSEGANLEPPASLPHSSDLPRIAKDVYFLDLTKSSEPRLYSLQRGGTWTTVDTASVEFGKIAGTMMGPAQNCESRLLDEVPAVIIPLPMNIRPAVTVTPLLKRCMYIGLDEQYLRDQMFPALVQRDFGKDATGLYSFTVRNHFHPDRIFYGSHAVPAGREGRSEVEHLLFAIRMEDMRVGRVGPDGAEVRARIFVRSFTARAGPAGRRRLAVNEDMGRWQLDVVPKSGPLESTLGRWREQNLLLSIAVELMLLAGVGFIVIATRRMHHLAEQKMQFVAGITHELRNPLSAICMLAGNQADGLVNSSDQVRQYGSLIRQQGERLNEMVEQALQYAGVHAKARLVRRTELDLRRVIDDALEARKAELQSAGFEVETNIAADLDRKSVV